MLKNSYVRKRKCEIFVLFISELNTFKRNTINLIAVAHSLIPIICKTFDFNENEIEDCDQYTIK